MKKIITSIVVASLAMTPVPSFAKKNNSIYLAIIPVVLLALLSGQKKGHHPHPVSP